MNKMNELYLGIDFGTSSVKLVAADEGGVAAREKCVYAAPDTQGWTNALKTALARLWKQVSPEAVRAVSFSSQVGTYIAQDSIIGWGSGEGQEELDFVLQTTSKEEFVSEIGMEHPKLISYPIPRLLYIKKHHADCRYVMMPKEYFIKELTGNFVSDPFSWRGLASNKNCKYSSSLLEKYGLRFNLPHLLTPLSKAGTVTSAAARKYGFSENTPVYVGCNDFYAGLLGMGVVSIGDVFDLSGTSEHIGIISESRVDGAFVSGEYFNGFATYGGTASSGVSCDFAINNFTLDGVETEQIYNSPPIFLPYLKGERAPIFDADARGVFFGISEKTDKKALAYSVLEGVAFSLYHIAQGIGITSLSKIISGGGSSKDRVLSALKSELFGCDVYSTVCDDNSALGAAIIAMCADKKISIKEGADRLVRYVPVASCTEKLKPILEKRFKIYVDIYNHLKDDFINFKELKL